MSYDEPLDCYHVVVWETDAPIVRREVIKVTDSFVYRRVGTTIRRWAKKMGNEAYFPTWKEAHEWLLYRLREEADRADEAAVRLRDRLRLAHTLKEE